MINTQDCRWDCTSNVGTVFCAPKWVSLCYKLLRYLLCLIVVVSYTNESTAQTLPSVGNYEDIEKISFKEDINNFKNGFKDADPFALSGSLGLNLRSYNAINIEDRQSPFTWVINGNVNVSVYKLRIPISVLLSAQNQSVSHPFTAETKDNFLKRRYTRVGASPYYKWVKLHLGHRNMNFSPLTVSNRTFLGVGLELTPGKLRFGSFYGGMPKTDPQDRALFGFNREIFSQKGLGFKLGYGTQRSFIDLIVFKANDKKFSNTWINQDTSNIFPVENTVVGLNTQWEIVKSLFLKFEIASSAFNQSINDPIISKNRFPFPGFIVNSRTSTQFRKAINGGITHNRKKMSIGVEYRRIEPEYRTLGAYFFNDDLEDYKLNLGFNLLKNKLRINTSGGLMRNNLFNEGSTKLLRTIGSINADYTLKAFNVNMNYSNYTSDLEYVLNSELDSLKAIIVTQNAGVTFNYHHAGKQKENRHNYMLNFSLQKVNDRLQNANRLEGNSDLFNSVFNYNFSMRETGWRINSMLSFTKSNLSNTSVNRIGAGLGVQKELIKNIWSLTINTNYFTASNQNINNQTVNVRLNSPMRLSKQHRIDIGMLYMTRTKSGINGRSSQEITGMLGYAYIFNRKNNVQR